LRQALVSQTVKKLQRKRLVSTALTVQIS
jgi:hypothetical protein